MIKGGKSMSDNHSIIENNIAKHFKLKINDSFTQEDYNYLIEQINELHSITEFWFSKFLDIEEKV